MTKVPVVDAEDEPAVEVIQDLVDGDRVAFHEAGCPVYDDEPCSCDVVVVYGPSGKA